MVVSDVEPDACQQAKYLTCLDSGRCALYTEKDRKARLTGKETGKIVPDAN